MWGQGRSLGFSLAEMLIALAVMSIALMALVSVLVSAMKAQSKTESSAAAHHVADQVQERLAVSLQTLEPTQSRSFWRAAEDASWSLGASPEVIADGVTYTTDITSSPILSDGRPLGTLGGDADNVARLVTVRVSWSADTDKVGQGRQEVSTRRIVSRSEQ